MSKIGLARMLFRFKEVFIMDEPTASLDPESENDFFSYIDNMKDKTIIFISHRLSNLSVANKNIYNRRWKSFRKWDS